MAASAGGSLSVKFPAALERYTGRKPHTCTWRHTTRFLESQIQKKKKNCELKRERQISHGCESSFFQRCMGVIMMDGERDRRTKGTVVYGLLLACFLILPYSFFSEIVYFEMRKVVQHSRLFCYVLHVVCPPRKAEAIKVKCTLDH